MSNRFKEFYSDFNFSPSDYKRVRIPIITSYVWGSGWPNTQDGYKFDAEVRNALEKAGFEVNEAKDSSSCLFIREKDGPYLYLHPMEFTGYLTDKQVFRVLEALDSVDSITGVGDVVAEDVYKISDSAYRGFLMRHVKKINKWLDEHPTNDGFDWADLYRIPRIYDKECLSSLDVDVSFVEDLLRLKKVFKFVEI